MIEIELNGKKREFATDTFINEMLAALALPNQRVAIELNGEVVRRPDWAQIKLNAGDRVEVVHFVGGG